MAPSGGPGDSAVSQLLGGILDAVRAGTGYAGVLRADRGRGRSTALWLLRAGVRQLDPTTTVLWCSSSAGTGPDGLDGAAGSGSDGAGGGAGSVHRVGELLQHGPVLVLVDDVHLAAAETAAELGHLGCRATGTRLGVVLTAPTGAPLHPDLERLPETVLPDPGEPEVRALLADRSDGTPPAVVAELLALCAAHPLVLREFLPTLDDVQLRGAAPLPRRATLGPRSMRLFSGPWTELPERTRRWLLVLALGSDNLATCVRAAQRLGLGLDDLAPAEAAGVVRTDRGGTVTWGSPLTRISVTQAATLAEATRAYRALAEVSSARTEPVEHPRWLARAMAAPSTDAEADPGQDQAALADAIVALAIDGRLLEGYELAREAEAVATDAARRQRYRVLAAGLCWLAGYGDHSLELLDQLPSPLPSADVHASAVVLRWVIQGLRDSWPTGQGVLELNPGPTGTIAGPGYASQAARSLGTALLAGWETLPAQSLSDTLAALRELFARYPEPRPGMTAALAKVVTGDNNLDSVERSALLAVSWWVHHDDALYPKVWPPPLLPVYLGDESGYARQFTGLLRTRHVRAARGTRALLLLKLATAQSALGHWPHALRNAASSRELARDMGLWALHTDALTLAAWVCAARGDEDGCLALMGAAYRQEGRRPAGGEPRMVQWTLGLLGLSMGRPAEAYQRLRPLHQDSVESPQHLAIRRLCTADFVEAAVQARQYDAAARSVAEFAAWVEGGAAEWARLDLARCRALTGEEGAEQWHLRALEHLGPVGRLATSARAELSFGSWLRRRKRYQEARSHLRLAQQYFDRLGAPSWRERAHAELRAAGEATTHSAGVAAALTAQEWQIARLAAEGRSNREIGDRLALSPRTVGYHLYKIFPKLDITSRTQLPLALRELDGAE
jgi:DNA-binding CsgD family transcriptional regulator